METTFQHINFRVFISVLIFFFLLSGLKIGLSQNLVAPVEVKPNKWILVNEKGSQIGQASFRHLKNFSEGLAQARDGSHWGYINIQGLMVIPTRYATSKAFSCGMAIVSEISSQYKCIDRSGNTIIPGPFSEVLPCTDSLFFAKKMGELYFRLFNYHGNEINPQALYSNAFPFSKGLAIVKSFQNNWQIINTKGEVLFTDPDCSYIIQQQEGMFPYRSKGKWGFIDSTLKIVIPAIFDLYYPFSNGYCTVKLQMEWMLLDKTGKTAQWSLGFKELGKYKEGLLAVRCDNNQWGFINSNGELVIPCKFEAVRSFNEGLAFVKLFRNKRFIWGYINTKGEWIIKPLLCAGKDSKNGFVLIKSYGGTWRFVTSKGEPLLLYFNHGYSFEKLLDTFNTKVEEEENVEEEK